MSTVHTIGELYSEGRHLLLNLAATLTPEQEHAPVPACPGWTVKDVYAHVAGVAADALAGRMEGVTTPPWTARQVAERADSSLVAICAEWAGTGPEFEEALKALGDSADPRVVLDQWNHEQDVRGAVAKPGSRSDPRADFVLAQVLAFAARALEGAGLPAVRVELAEGTEPVVVGPGDPAVVLRTSAFELCRTVFGRRSRAQALALGWTPADEGVVGPIVDRLHIFDHAATDIVE